MSIKVVPGSSRSGIAGWLGESLKVRVSEPAEGGRANAAVERTIAAALGVPVACARVVAGGGEGKVSQARDQRPAIPQDPVRVVVFSDGDTSEFDVTVTIDGWGNYPTVATEVPSVSHGDPE